MRSWISIIDQLHRKIQLSLIFFTWRSNGFKDLPPLTLTSNSIYVGIYWFLVSKVLHCCTSFLFACFLLDASVAGTRPLRFVLLQNILCLVFCTIHEL